MMRTIKLFLFDILHISTLVFGQIRPIVADADAYQNTFVVDTVLLLGSLMGPDNNPIEAWQYSAEGNGNTLVYGAGQ